MDATETSEVRGSGGSSKPMSLVLGVMAFAFVASFIVTSLRRYGGFNYVGHATVLSDAIFEAIGAVLILPLIHLAIASLWRAKRNSRSRRNIFLGWGVAVGIIQLFNFSQVSGLMESRTAAQVSKAVAPSSTFTEQDQKRVTLEEWSRNLGALLNIQLAEKLPGGGTLASGCVNAVGSGKCVEITVRRQPFEMARIVTPRSQEKLEAAGSSALLLPFIWVEDGKKAKLFLFAYLPEAERKKYLTNATSGGLVLPSSSSMTEISVVSDNNLSFERSDYSGVGNDNDLAAMVANSTIRRFGVPTDRVSPVIMLSDSEVGELLKVKPGSGVAIRFQGATDVNLSDKNAEQFAGNLQDMIKVYSSLRGNLIPVND